MPPATEKLTVGDLVWEPERAPDGPVLIVVSVPEQVAYVRATYALTSTSSGAGQQPSVLALRIVNLDGSNDQEGLSRICLSARRGDDQGISA